MSSITADGLGAPAASPVGAEVGPLEQKHLQNANYRAVAGSGEITKDALAHRHCQRAGLGFRRHGRRDLRADLAADDQGLRAHRPEYRSGLQIALFFGIAGLYFWPWLSDRFGRRTLLAVNIALFSLLMPVVALSPTFAIFVVAARWSASR